MKTLHSYSQRTQPVSPEALQHIMALADRDNRGVVERSARYCQRAKKRRLSVAAILIALVAFSAQMLYADTPSYTVKKISGTIDCAHAEDMVYYILNKA